MVETGETSLRSIPTSSSPPPPPPLPPPPTTSNPPCSVSRHDQIATIKRNLNFLQRATQQPPPTSMPRQSPTLQPQSNSPPSPPKSPTVPSTQSPQTRKDCYVLEPAWTTFINHFQVSYPPPGYKNPVPVFSCPPPPLGQVDVKTLQNLPPPIRRPSAETTESSASFEFAIEAEKMVSELCSSSKDFSEKAPAVDTSRFDTGERRRHTEPWSIKPREVCTHDTEDYNQNLHISQNPNDVNTRIDLSIQLPCIYEDDLCLREFISKGCLEFDNILKGYKRNSHFGDLIGFGRMIRESAENPSANELHHDEVRSQILTFFRLASSWLNIYPLVERAGMPKDGFRPLMYQYFNDWQIATRRMMELIVKNVPSLKERLDAETGADVLAYGDQAYKRQPFPPMHYDLQRNSMDNLKRQRSVPNVQGHHRQWRQRRFTDNHDGENNGCNRNILMNPKDVNNRNKWTIVSPDMFYHKNQCRKPDMHSQLNSRLDYQDNSESRGNRYTSKVHLPECTTGRSPIFNEEERMANWPKYQKYPATEVVNDAPYKVQDDSNENVFQDDLVRQNHMVLLSQIEPRCAQKHNDQQPVDLDALFQGYRIANRTPEKSGSHNRQVCKMSPNQGQMRYAYHDNKFNSNQTQGQPNRVRRWYNNYNFCPPPWVANSSYEHDRPDDLHDGVYMKPGSYDVPKRNHKPIVKQFTTPPPQIAPPASPVIAPPSTPRCKPGPPDEVTWQAALASAETLCKSLRSSDSQAHHPDAEQQWMIRTIQSSSSSESDETETKCRQVETNEAEEATAVASAAAAVTAADVTTTKTVSKKIKGLRERKCLSKAAKTPPPSSPSPTSQPTQSSPPPPPPSTSASPPSQPLSACQHSFSPSSSREIQRFLETVWAVKEATHIKFPPDQKHDGADSKRVLEDTFQRLLDDGWATGGVAGGTAVSHRQNKQ